ncbi:hypothetical protein DPEC_G00294810 [Dallia pectoralis]|uniref:Uncharacterized protein n=1 Tax=Dallia pectoralis TaxID=75939 RepID=A0ACC2FIT6_DALPE|nr:hypothetical protein DPEC_G00294810 [Dallia pectoralis]
MKVCHHGPLKGYAFGIRAKKSLYGPEPFFGGGERPSGKKRTLGPSTPRHNNGVGRTDLWAQRQGYVAEAFLEVMTVLRSTLPPEDRD